MKSDHLKNKIGRIVLALSFLAGIGLVSSTAVQAQRPWDRDQDRRDRDYRRDRDNDRNRNDRYGRNGNNGGYGNVSQIAINQGYQDGLNTGSNDAQRGQSYDPQRSHFYRNGHGDNGGNYRNAYQFQQPYRDGFLRGYADGYRRNGGYNRNRRGNGNYGRLPFPW